MAIGESTTRTQLVECFHVCLINIIFHILMLIESTIIIIFLEVVIRLIIMACSSSIVGVMGAFGRWEENDEQENKSLAALHLTGAVLTHSLGDHGEHEVNVPRGSVVWWGCVGCRQKVRQAFICCNLHVGSIWAFNKKILEASGMVFWFHSLQVTFFGISQSDCIKKILQVKKKKLDVKLNWHIARFHRV